ncbi:MAG: radical SAM protein [Chloroflexota bacterium]|nr:MAG: radical SAM protein [Chloroflexota bacterium]
MRTLLVQPRQRGGLGFKSLAMVEPLGLEMVAGALESRGHEVRILDLVVPQDLATALEEFQPQLCGINCSFTIDVYQTLRVAAEARAARSAPFVLVGGHHATLNPQDFLDPSVDAIAVGEGELLIQELADGLASRRDLSQIPGLALNHGKEQFFTGQRSLIHDLDSLALPARHLTDEHRRNKQYFMVMEIPMATCETARGCPYHCNFCSVWQFYQGKTRTKSPQRVVEDLARVREKKILFTDDNFLLNVNRAAEIAELLRQNKIKKNYFFQARSDSISRHPEVISLWKEVGLTGVFVGFEKIDDEELKSIDKSNSAATNDTAVEVLGQRKVGIIGGFIVDPNYGPAQFEKLRQYIRSRPAITNPTFTVLTPLPGTKLFDEISDRLVTEDYELFDLMHAVLPTHMSIEEFYREFTTLWHTAYRPSLGKWLGMISASWAMSRAPASHFRRIISTIKILTNPDCYLAGHLGARGDEARQTSYQPSDAGSPV